MSFYDWLKRRDRASADRLAGDEYYFSLSPTRWSLYRALRPRMSQYLRGRCLDAGAGRMAFACQVDKQVEDYIPLDLQLRPGLKIVGSVLDLPLRDVTLDSILCLQVLEHVPDPERALREFFRCLKPGGTLLLSVPHLAYLHNEPHDYFRYTRHGLEVLLRRAGFGIVEIQPAGGLLAFLGHIPSMVAKALFFGIPGINRLAVRLNSGYSKLVCWIDERVEKRKLYALNFIAAARKPHDRPPDRHA